jgi:hypothetical protein
MSTMWAWFLFGWHWLFCIMVVLLIFGVAGVVAWFFGEEGDPEDVAAFDAYLDDVEDGYIDLPGPEQTESSGGNPDPFRAGEYHELAPVHYMDTWLGRPGDGSEHTALRVRREGDRMKRAYEEEQAAYWADMGMSGPWKCPKWELDVAA